MQHTDHTREKREIIAFLVSAFAPHRVYLVRLVGGRWLVVALVYLAQHAHALMNQPHRGVAFAGPRRCSSLLSTLCLSLAGSTELLVPAMAAAPARSLQINHGQRGKDGTGAMVWHAALILAEWLGDNANQISGTSVLELGAGTGACSIFAAGLGASRVMATDGEEGLRKLAADNFELNRNFT